MAKAAKTPSRGRTAFVTGNLSANSAVAEAELGYTAVPLEQMLARSIDWPKVEGLIATG